MTRLNRDDDEVFEKIDVNNMTFWQKIDAHLSNIAFYQIVFSLPFAYMAVLLANKAHGLATDWQMVLWVTTTIVAARSAALALDNMIDLKYDKDQPRFNERPMVAGLITHRDVYLLLAICFAVLIFSVLQLNPVCIKLLPVAALPFIVYPYMKRLTCLCHYICGVAVAMAPAGAWVAVTGEVEYPMVVLFLAVVLWIGGFDVVYGAQDEEFDKEHGLHSMATLLGAEKALLLAKLTHVVTLAVFFYLGQLFGLGYLYYIGVGIAGGTLYYQHKIIDVRGFRAFTRRYYVHNGIVSVAIFICTLLDVLLHG